MKRTCSRQLFYFCFHSPPAGLSSLSQELFHKNKLTKVHSANLFDQVDPAVHNLFFRITFLDDASGVSQFLAKFGV